MGYSCFTMSCQFLLHSEVNQACVCVCVCVCVCIYIPSLLDPHLTNLPQPISLGNHRTLS